MKKSFLIIFLLSIITTLTSIVTYTVTKNHKKNHIIYLHEQKTRSIEDSVLKEFIQHGNVILIFYEDWCGPCKRMKPLFEELVEEIDNIIFIKVKRSLYRDLFNQFKLTTIPAMVFFKQGKVVHIRPKSATKEKLLQIIKRVFD